VFGHFCFKQHRWARRWTSAAIDILLSAMLTVVLSVKPPVTGNLSLLSRALLNQSAIETNTNTQPE